MKIKKPTESISFELVVKGKNLRKDGTKNESFISNYK